jgi:hypothetical protein
VRWLPDVAAAQREFVRLAGGRPTFQWIEASTWKCDTPALRVTATTVRAESWLAIAGGARGLGFFPADWPSEMAPGVTAVTREVTALAAALLAPDTPASSTAPVIAAARALNGALYVIAVNPTRQKTRATITAPGSAGRQADVLSESRTIIASGDTITDSFGPRAVHVYVFSPI